MMEDAQPMKTESSDSTMARKVDSSEIEKKQNIAAVLVKGSTFLKMDTPINNEILQSTTAPSLDDLKPEHVKSQAGSHTGTVKMEDSNLVKMEVSHVPSNVLPFNNPVKVEEAVNRDSEVDASAYNVKSEHVKSRAWSHTGTAKMEESNPVKMGVDHIPSNAMPSNNPVKAGEPSNYDNKTDDEDEEEYCGGDPRDDILELLQEVESSGSFACWGKGNPEMCMPGLKINGINHTISLPLCPDIAKKIANRCEQAPFGRGEKTVVDTSVRKTEQLDPSKFQITNPSWKIHLNSIVSSVRDELGVMPNVNVEAQLYKLLLYEPGSFFSPHRDSEKADGMFATLVVILPSKYSGGELVVAHNGESKEIDQSPLSEFNAQYAAFYADCIHELKKLDSGYRLCIVYNLVKVGFGPRPSVSQNNGIMKSLKSAAKAWAQNFDGNKLVIMTDHLYTPAGMKSGAGTAKFKGKDAAITSFLEAAAEAGIDLDWDHGTVSFSESGYAMGEYYHRYRDGPYLWGGTNESEMTLYLHNHGGVSINREEEMVPSDFYEDKDPEDENFEPTGNAGVQAERQYSDEDAIVVWPKSRGWEVLSGGDVSEMLSYYSKNVHTHDKSWKMEKLGILSRKMIDKGNSSSVEEFIGILNSDVSEEMRKFAKDFIRKYIQAASLRSSIPNELSPAFRGILNIYSEDYDRLVEDLLLCISPRAYRTAPDHVVTFIKAFHTASLSHGDQMSKRVVSKAVQCMELGDCNTVTAVLSATSVKTCLALFLEAESKNEWVEAVVSFIKNVNKESCQDVKQKHSCYSPLSSVKKGLGPVSLCNSGIKSCCEKFGWKTLEGVVKDAVEKMIQMGSLSSALIFVRELKSDLFLPIDNDRTDVCQNLVNIVVQEGVKLSQAPTADTLKDLFFMLPVNSSPMSELFVENVLKLDMKILYPFLISVAVGKITPTSPLGQIAIRCARRLSKTAYMPLQKERIWSIIEHTRFPCGVESFLRSPCKIEYDYKLAKSQHKEFLKSLEPYIKAGQIRATPHQYAGRGYWYVKIIKLRGTEIDPRSLGQCDCLRHLCMSATGTCVYQSTKVKIDKIDTASEHLKSILTMLPAELAKRIEREKNKAVQPACEVVAGQPQQEGRNKSKKKKAVLPAGQGSPEQPSEETRFKSKKRKAAQPSGRAASGQAPQKKREVIVID